MLWYFAYGSNMNPVRLVDDRLTPKGVALGRRVGGRLDGWRLAFDKVYPDMTSYAVWLFNEQRQRPLGNAIFRWLLAEATTLDDSRAVALMANNTPRIVCFTGPRSSV